MGAIGTVLGILIVVIVVGLLLSCVKVVQQAQAWCIPGNMGRRAPL